MTLSDEILARDPQLYWPAFETSGTQLEDVSGHGHPGTLGGSYMLGQYGLEAGTTCVQFSPGGYARCTGLPQPGAAAFSVFWVCSINALAPGGTTIYMQHGDNVAKRGWLWLVNTTPQHQFQTWNTAGSVFSTTLTALPIWNKWWHSWCFTHNGSGTTTWYIDGFPQTAPTLTGTPTTVLSTDYFQCLSPYGSTLGHVAYFDKVLTPADVAVLAGFRYDWPFGPMVNAIWPNPPTSGGTSYLSPSDPIVIQQQADTADIRRAVIRDYSAPPPGPITP